MEQMTIYCALQIRVMEPGRRRKFTWPHQDHSNNSSSRQRQAVMRFLCHAQQFNISFPPPHPCIFAQWCVAYHGLRIRVQPRRKEMQNADGKKYWEVQEGKGGEACVVEHEPCSCSPLETNNYMTIAFSPRTRKRRWPSFFLHLTAAYGQTIEWSRVV